MVDVGDIEKTLAELKKSVRVEDAVIVSKSGRHIAGDVPKGAHTETFSAMFAILLGAAETATSELNEKLDHALLNLGGAKILVINSGPKALIVLKLTVDANVDEVVEKVKSYSKKLEEHI